MSDIQMVTDGRQVSFVVECHKQTWFFSRSTGSQNQKRLRGDGSQSILHVSLLKGERDFEA